MKFINQLTLMTFMILGNSHFLCAQSREGSISGTVVDGGDQKIIDAATISLFKMNDSSLMKISLADKTGAFLFEHVPFGKYYLLASSTGHTQTYSKTVEVNQPVTVETGILRLNADMQTLSAISVEAAIKKPFIERKLDRTVINVDASITNAGTTALEVLEKSP